MTNDAMQHALREMRRTFIAPITQIILSAIVVLLGLSGPFGTLEAMTFGPRLAYWAVTVPVTFAVGVLSSSFIAEALRTNTSEWVIRVSVTLATALSVGLTVVCLNWLAFGNRPISFTSMVPIMATAGVIALVIHYMSDQPASRARPNIGVAPLLDRLDLHKRGALISMSVQDHYVEITTTAGTSLILLRLSDAMRETGDVDGLQIHRSHWVARAHIKAAQRDGDKAILTLSDGRTLPASRSHINALKTAGILPR